MPESFGPLPMFARKSNDATLQNLDDRSSGPRIHFLHPGHHVARDGEHAFSARCVLAVRCDGFPSVAANAYLRIDLNFTQKWHTEILGHMLAFAMAKYVNAPLAMRAIEVAHVLDHAKNLDVHLAKHFDGLAYIRKGHDRRRRHHHSPSL